MKNPNFFIIGAPKCGTTALSEYLREHHEVFMTQPKEPHYFAEDFVKHRHSKDWADYYALFNEASDQHVAVGEASVWYLYSSVALRNIWEYNYEAKLIVMLRNPIDMVHSLHSQMLFSLYEDVPDFETAWLLQEKRQQRLYVPRNCLEPAFLQYKSACLLGDQVERLLQIFPREQIKFILFDDFVADTARIYREVLAFLNLQNIGREEFLPINQNAVPRLKVINYIVLATPTWLGKLIEAGRQIRAWLGLEWVKPFQKLRAINTKQVKRSTLSAEMRQNLYREFEPDIQKLSTLIHRDLSSWH